MLKVRFQTTRWACCVRSIFGCPHLYSVINPKDSLCQFHIPEELHVVFNVAETRPSSCVIVPVFRALMMRECLVKETRCCTTASFDGCSLPANILTGWDLSGVWLGNTSTHCSLTDLFGGKKEATPKLVAVLPSKGQQVGLWLITYNL